MKIEVDEIRTTLTSFEARIIAAFMGHWSSDDPYGDTATELGEDINYVVTVCDQFREGLKSRISS